VVRSGTGTVTITTIGVATVTLCGDPIPTAAQETWLSEQVPGPKTSQPPTTSKWLGETLPPGKPLVTPENQPQPEQGTGKDIRGELSVVTILPSLLAVLFAMPWKIIHMNVSSLEAYNQMAKSGGSSLSGSILGGYRQYTFNWKPLPVLTAGLVYLSAMVIPLASETWRVGLVGSCRKGENDGCWPVIEVLPQVARLLEVLLLLLAILTAILVFRLQSWSTGLFADPRSILGVASAVRSRGLVQMINITAQTNSTGKQVAKEIGDTNVFIGYSSNYAGQVDHGIHSANPSNPPATFDPTVPISATTSSAASKPMPVVWMLLFLTLSLSVILALWAVIISYWFSTSDTPFERFMSGQEFGPRFLLACFGVLINFLWVKVFNGTNRIEIS
jgi:hypothetical protein